MANQPAPTSLTPKDIELATRAADNFTTLYYRAYDSAERVSAVPQFYRPSSSLTWNGNPYQGVDGVRELLEKMPRTTHDILSYDCHPIPGSQPPSLLVNVSGNVTFGRTDPNPKSKNLDAQPRVFSQTFVLVHDPSVPITKAGEVATYFVSADALRFVG